MQDFPAAHSMDTAWFAVDADGHVGRFDTGEDGALPVRAAHRGGPDDPNFDVDALLRALDEREPGVGEGERSAYAVRLPGVFDFTRDHGDDPGRYLRAHVPDQPVRLSELPPSSRGAVGRLVLPVRFSDAEVVHLADHLDDAEAATWGDWPLRWPPGGAQVFFEAQAAARSPARTGLVVLLVLVGLAALAWWLG